jgi:hypothetical protein
MMKTEYEVCKYSINALKDKLVETTLASRDLISNKLHTIYFEEYFDHLKAKTFLVEYDYIDHDFLEDFSYYYVKCFKKYKRKCARYHFFNIEFTRSEFDAILKGVPKKMSIKKLKDAYLGFIVVKPLPETIIGRTCLATYESDKGRRHFGSARDYVANLFGISLQVDTIAYQEQDTVVAACATSALWSVFNSTGRLFQHQIMSPVEISEVACQNLPFESRFFPNPRLSPERMAQAIRCVGLEPYLIPAEDQAILKAAAYSYLKCKIPMLLGLQIADISQLPKGKAKPMGLHAIAITGFSSGKTTPQPFGKTGFLSVASMIDKIYAHDDQVGPFARMIMDYDEVAMDQKDGNRLVKTIYTSWRGDDGGIGTARAIPTVLLIPLYNKIRLPFSIIQETIIYFDEIIERYRQSGAIPFPERIVWDIYLTTVNEVKSEMLLSKALTGKLKMYVLLESLPRFIWRATAYCQDEYIIDLFFDATDLEQSSYLISAVGYHEEFFNSLVELGQNSNLPKNLSTGLFWKILEWFSRQGI